MEAGLAAAVRPSERGGALDLLLVGIPGPLFDWARSGIAAASGVPPVDAAELSLAPTAASRSVPRRWGWTHHLTPALALRVQQELLPVVATFDAPEDACARAGEAGVRALRRIEGWLYALADLRGLGTVLAIESGDQAAALFAHCGLQAGGQGAPRAALPRDPALRTLFAPALAYVRRGERSPQVWPRHLLLAGDAPDQPLQRLIGLTGPARNLAYGPYLHFSPGPARLAVVIAASAGCRHAEMAIELHGGGMLGRGRFTLDGPGLFSAEIEATIPSHRQRLEIRLKSERGAIDGVIGVDQVRLTPGKKGSSFCEQKEAKKL